LTSAGGFKTVGDLKHYFADRFKGVILLTLKNAGKTNSPVPLWALERIKIAFNVEELRETVVGCGFLNVLSFFHSVYCISCIFQRFFRW
jgi:hypothetical protein